MNTSWNKRIVAALSGAVLLFGMARANDSSSSGVLTANQDLGLMERNIVQALESGIPGLEVSAALTLKQVKLLLPSVEFSRTVIPLMRLVKDQDKNPRVRSAAALALHELHSATGDYAISRAAIFTDDHLVRHMLGAIASDGAGEESRSAE